MPSLSFSFRPEGFQCQQFMRGSPSGHVELDALGERQRPAEIDGVGCAPHVGLPRI
jgi:hypothetical protein